MMNSKKPHNEAKLILEESRNCYGSLKAICFLLVIASLANIIYAKPLMRPKLLDIQVGMERDSFTLGDTISIDLHLTNLNREFSKSSEINIKIDYVPNRLKLINNTEASFNLRSSEIDNYSKKFTFVALQCGYMYLTVTTVDKEAMISSKEAVQFYVYDSGNNARILGKSNTKTQLYRRIDNNAINNKRNESLKLKKESKPLQRND